MASLAELEQWEELLYQLETTDPVVGGVDGVSNRQAKQLGNRTRYLLRKLLEGNLSYVVDTGVANAYVATYSPEITSLKDGMVLRFKAVNANTGASTLAVNGLAAYPILGGGNSVLQGGEIVAAGLCSVQWSASLSSFILQENAGGAKQIADASKSKHAMNLGMLSAVLSNNGYLVIPCINSDGTKKNVIIQWGEVSSLVQDDQVAAFVIPYPNACFYVSPVCYGFNEYSIGIAAWDNSVFTIEGYSSGVRAIKWISIGH